MTKLAIPFLVAAMVVGGCSRGNADAGPPVPATSDPLGNDLVLGAVVAAEEKVGGMRLYKITHVDDFPDPIGYEYHMIAYDPKAATFEEASKLWRERAVKVAMEHLTVRQVHFLPRAHRVLGVEALTEVEKATYAKARDSRKR